MQELKALYWRFDNYANIGIASFYGVLAGMIAFIAVIPLEVLDNTSIAAYIVVVLVLLIVAFTVEITLVTAHKKISDVIGVCQTCKHRLKRHENKKGETHICSARNWHFERCTCEHFVRKEA